MTREEAIAYWKQRSEHIHNWLEENEDVDFIGEYVEAIDMAIEALQKDIERHEMVIRASERHSGIVWCKDCRQYIPHDLTDDRGWCCEYKTLINEDDFCSRGERETTEMRR